MIVKKRIIPLRILIDEALLRRLPLNHPKRSEILQDLLIRKSGFKGEQDMDYYLSLLNDSEFNILQDLRIPLGKNHFQIDFLILSHAFFLLIENKNMPGIIEFDPDFNQVIRKHNDKVEIYDDPVLQVKRQLIQFVHWLKLNRFTIPPIEFLVTYSNQGSILQNPTKNEEIYKRVCKGGSVVMKVEEFKNKHKKDIFSEKELKKLTKLLIKSHQPEGSHLSKFNLSPADFLQGVACPSCRQLYMERISGSWHCTSCGYRSADAHVQVIMDYFLIGNPSITNKQLRRLLRLSSDKTASRILLKMDLPFSGTTKNRVYYPK
ncbi:NERD domain-containing protein [Mesobacillus jeotgali]|uniref:NERD domain-containing protein n=1 Tax=Mesobacillus jeotgali TaxID=129985 RepID=UPI0015912A29|nr:NERD domain-containing protein [Mesobacillus jeotgali]